MRCGLGCPGTSSAAHASERGTANCGKRNRYMHIPWRPGLHQRPRGRRRNGRCVRHSSAGDVDAHHSAPADMQPAAHVWRLAGRRSRHKVAPRRCVCQDIQDGLVHDRLAPAEKSRHPLHRGGYPQQCTTAPPPARRRVSQRSMWTCFPARSRTSSDHALAAACPPHSRHPRCMPPLTPGTLAACPPLPPGRRWLSTRKACRTRSRVSSRGSSSGSDGRAPPTACMRLTSGVNAASNGSTIRWLASLASLRTKLAEPKPPPGFLPTPRSVRSPANLNPRDLCCHGLCARAPHSRGGRNREGAALARPCRGIRNGCGRIQSGLHQKADHLSNPLPPPSPPPVLAQRKGGVRTPKPFGLVVDHSRVAQMKTLAEAPAAAGGSAPSSLAPACSSFVRRMRDASGGASRLLASAAARAELSQCIDHVASLRKGSDQARDGSGSPAPAAAPDAAADGPSLRAYRASVPGGILLTSVRWPPARFTSAVEQFGLPMRTGVPCSKWLARAGGACHGHTCERDFSFSWTCLNASVRQAPFSLRVLRVFRSGASGHRARLWPLSSRRPHLVSAGASHPRHAAQMPRADDAPAHAACRQPPHACTTHLAAVAHLHHLPGRCRARGCSLPSLAASSPALLRSRPRHAPSSPTSTS